MIDKSMLICDSEILAAYCRRLLIDWLSMRIYLYANKFTEILDANLGNNAEPFGSKGIQIDKQRSAIRIRQSPFGVLRVIE